MIDITQLSSLSDIEHESMIQVQRVPESRNFGADYRCSQLIFTEFEMLRLVDLMDIILLLAHNQFSREKCTYVISQSLKGFNNNDMHSNIYRAVFFLKQSFVTDHQTLHSDISLKDHGIYLEPRLSEEAKSVLILSIFFYSILIKFSMLPWPVRLLELILN